MSQIYNVPIRYRLLSQYRDGELVRIVDLTDNRELSMPAHKIACDQNMIAYFTPIDACAIGYIVGARNDKRQAQATPTRQAVTAAILEAQAV